MISSLRALLVSIIDYAGLFPPARLPLEQAIRLYCEYRQGADAWMLGRFVCPASSLEELQAHADLFTIDQPLVVSALGRSGTTMEEFLDQLQQDLSDIERFHDQLQERARVDILEIRLPTELPTDGDEQTLITFLGQVQQACSRESLAQGGMSLFLEASPTTDGMERTGAWIGALGRYQEQTADEKPTTLERIGFKLRCGGVDADAIPMPTEVAYVMNAVQSAGIAMKCTAGLHHPFRHFDAELQARMHGFFNVFVAGILARTHSLGEDQIREILEEEEPAAFAFEDSGVRYRDWEANLRDILTARRDGILSFGSCSFKEPLDDLRTLGLLGGSS